MNINPLKKNKTTEKKPLKQGNRTQKSQQKPPPEFAVIGLGRFGLTLAMSLIERGFPVLGIDKNASMTQHNADKLTEVLTLDATDEHTLRDIDIKTFETVIVAVGDHLEESILTTVILKDLGVKTVITQAFTLRHRQILLAVGADSVVLPEIDGAKHLAQQLTKPAIVDQLVIGPAERVSQVKVSPSLCGKHLGSAALNERFGVHVLAAVRDGHALCGPPSEYVLQEGDYLILHGTRDDLAQMAAK